MLRKILTGIALSVLFSASAQAQSTWVEGEHYEVIAEKASAKPQVKEVFSFWCPHCFTFEPVAQQLEKSLPAGVSFKKAHVNFMGGVDRETQDAATLAMIAAKAKVPILPVSLWGTEKILQKGSSSEKSQKLMLQLSSGI